MNKKKFPIDLITPISLVAAIASITIMLSRFVGFFDREIMYGALLVIIASIFGAFSAYMFARLMKRKAVIFASFSYADKETAMKVINDLKSDGYRILIPEEIIVVGDSIQTALNNSISRANFFLYFMSQNSLSSKWVSTEYEYARTSNVKVLPVLILKVDLPEELRDIFYVDFSENYDQAYKLLEKSIRKNVSHLQRPSYNTAQTDKPQT